MLTDAALQNCNVSDDRFLNYHVRHENVNNLSNIMYVYIELKNTSESYSE